MRYCAYCHSEWKEKNGACVRCGAPNSLAEVYKSSPFFYDKGVTFIGAVRMRREELHSLEPGFDIMPVVMEKLKAKRVGCK